MDFDKYVGYAKARIEREEYREVLNWALAAQDCASDRQAFLTNDWLTELVDDALAKAEEFRKENDWRGAWRVYSRLSLLHEEEPRYETLEREAVEHLRLDNLFKENTHWEERIEHVRNDAAGRGSIPCRRNCICSGRFLLPSVPIGRLVPSDSG